MGSAQVSIVAEWEVGDDNPISTEKHLVWHWGKMTHNPSKTIVNFLSSVFGLVFLFSFFFFCRQPAEVEVEEEIEREKRRFRKQRERERERERESQTFFFLGIRDRL